MDKRLDLKFGVEAKLRGPGRVAQNTPPWGEELVGLTMEEVMRSRRSG